MRRIHEILTPENVKLEYELAGMGSRFAAIFIDIMLQTALILAVSFGMLMGGMDIRNIGTQSSIIIALGIVLLFVIFFGYYVFFEMLMNGQSPGKKALKLRVIKQTGEPVGVFDSFLRNILRIADFLPCLNLAGALTIVFSQKYKRIGDFAANTIVVKVKINEQPVTLESLLKKANSSLEEEEQINIYPVNNFEYSILKEFLARHDRLGERKSVFIYHLDRYFSRKFGIQNLYSSPYEFFEKIIKMNSGI